jgi:glycyl-tRNA synthetase beta subunit
VGATLEAYARCRRITRGENTIHAVNPERFVESATRALYAAYRRATEHVTRAPNVDGFMTALVELRPAISTFFDEVLVMAEDMNLRNNRLGLLQAIGALADGIVDLTLMEGF